MSLLNFTPIIMPIPIEGGSLTEKECNIFIGIWIVLNALWVISWIISIIKYYWNKKKLPFRWNFDGLFYGAMAEFSDILMLFFWGVIIICWLGYKVSQFL